MGSRVAISCHRGTPAVMYSFGATSCSTCASTDVRQVGLFSALYHESWCPKAPDNQGRPVHPTRKATTCTTGPDGRKTWGTAMSPCNGIIRYVKPGKVWVCQRCNERSTILSNLTLED